jgi:hypothetical protein
MKIKMFKGNLKKYDPRILSVRSRKGYWPGILKERDHLKNLDINEIIILKWNSKEMVGREIWTKFLLAQNKVQ